MGRNWALLGEGIEIFGILAHQGQAYIWFVDLDGQSKPEPLAGSIGDKIKASVGAVFGSEVVKRYYKADALMIGPRQAAGLYFEGILTSEALEQAVEIPDQISTKITVAGEEYKLIIRPGMNDVAIWAGATEALDELNSKG